jgi:hypothetical protein
MIVVNDLDAIFSNYLIEVRARYHVLSLSEGVLLDLRVMKYGSEFLPRMQVYSDLSLVVNFIKVDIWHFHLFFMD